MATYLRVIGVVSARGVYTPVTGWETDEIVMGSEPAGSVVVELLDNAGAVLVRARASSHVLACGLAGTPDAPFVDAHMPFHPMATTLRVVDGDVVLHEAPIAPKPPKVRISSLVLTRTTLRAQWEVDHTCPVRSTVWLQPSESRRYPIAVSSDQNELTVRTRALPGGPRCRLAVLVSDGVRSAIATSRPFALAGASPVAQVFRPADGEVLPAGQPVTLLGHVSELDGFSLPDEELVWRLDGRIVARAARLAAIDPPSPGRHTITLSHTSSRQARESISIEVEQLPEGYEEWVAMVAALDSATRT